MPFYPSLLRLAFLGLRGKRDALLVVFLARQLAGCPEAARIGSRAVKNLSFKRSPQGNRARAAFMASYYTPAPRPAPWAETQRPLAVQVITKIFKSEQY